MPLSLTTDIILKSVGKRVKNSSDETLGEIIEVTRNASGSRIEYAILKSDEIIDKQKRFFAIPVSSTLMKITESGEIVLFTNKDELQSVNGIRRDQCPSPNFHVKPPIFELFEYQGPQV